MTPRVNHDRGLPYHILGSKEDDRHLKSRFEHSEQASGLSILRNHALNLYRVLMALRQRRGLPALTLDEALLEYRGLRSIYGLHKELSGHMLQVGGFGVKAAVEAARLSQMEEGGIVSPPAPGPATTSQQPQNGNGAHAPNGTAKQYA